MTRVNLRAKVIAIYQQANHRYGVTLAIDDVDLELVHELARNSKATYRKMGDKLGLSANSILKRVQELESMGAIEQFTVALTPKALPQVWVRICGMTETAITSEAMERLGKNPITYAVSVASGNFLYVTGILHDLSEMSRYVNFVVSEGKMANPIYGILENPVYGLLARVQLQETSEVVLTKTDYRILASLQNNCRKPLAEVAQDLGMTARTVRRRLERMEKNSLIYYSVRFHPISSGNICTIIHLYFKDKVENMEIASAIFNKYSRFIVFVGVFSTIPDHIIINVVPKTMAELKALQDSLYNEGLFEKIVLNIVYDMRYFDTWCDAHIREQALQKDVDGRKK